MNLSFILYHLPIVTLNPTAELNKDGRQRLNFIPHVFKQLRWSKIKGYSIKVSHLWSYTALLTFDISFDGILVNFITKYGKIIDLKWIR